MSYSVHNHWDPLKKCIVGKTYPPDSNFAYNDKFKVAMTKNKGRWFITHYITNDIDRQP